MEENKVQKQNRTLKVILALLSVLIVLGLFVAAIGGTYYFATKSESESFASKKSSLPEVTRSSPSNGTSENANTANANAVPTPSPTPAAPVTAAPNKSNFALVGKWVSTRPNGDKTTYVFESPKKIGNLETGALRITSNFGKEYQSIYTVVSSSLLKVRDEGGSSSSDWNYEVEADGRSLKLILDGNTLNLTKSK